MISLRSLAVANAMDISRGKFLTAAANHYASIVPATSAQLLSQNVSEIAEGNSRMNMNDASAACKACGTILVPGWTSRTTILDKGRLEKSQKSRTGSHRQTKDGRHVDKFLRADCLKCYRYLEEPLPELRRSNRKPALVTNPSGTSAAHKSSPSSTAKPTTTNTRSKQRAKARKHGGLQAMLEKSKASADAGPGYGLNLLDLMKQG